MIDETTSKMNPMWTLSPELACYPAHTTLYLMNEMVNEMLYMLADVGRQLIFIPEIASTKPTRLGVLVYFTEDCIHHRAHSSMGELCGGGLCAQAERYAELASEATQRGYNTKVYPAEM